MTNTIKVTGMVAQTANEYDLNRSAEPATIVHDLHLKYNNLETQEALLERGDRVVGLGGKEVGIERNGEIVLRGELREGQGSTVTVMNEYGYIRESYRTTADYLITKDLAGKEVIAFIRSDMTSPLNDRHTIVSE